MRRHFAWVLAILLATPFLTYCSSVPGLQSEPGSGPSVRQIVNHINCELASIIASNPSVKKQFAAFKSQYRGPTDQKIEEREAADPKLKKLLPLLQEDHFVASVLLTLDTTDTQGIYPAASFIQPIGTAFSRTLSVGANLNGTQERNVTFGYSIDLANVGRGCSPEKLSPDDSGVNGTLELADIVADGLAGLDSTEQVNVYNSGGPMMPAFDALLNDLDLGLTCADSTNCGQHNLDGQKLRLSGIMNFAPAGDPLQPGTMTFAGKAEGYKKDAEGRYINSGDKYVVTLQGSTVNTGDRTHVKFTLSGGMTRDTGAPVKNTIADQLGFNPTISLVGTLNYHGKLVAGIKDTRGAVTPSSEKGGPGGDRSLIYNIHKPDEPDAGADHAFNTKKMRDQVASEKFPPAGVAARPSGGSGSAAGGAATSASGGGGGGGGNGSPAKTASLASASGTQFGSLIQFTIAYGLNGGPNWTLQKFKGPGGGSGSGGNLFGLSRQRTDTLQITFVAACNDEANVQTVNTYWDSIPKCNGTQQAIAGAVGQNLLYQAQPFATLR
jgi:hypothetical protein